MQHTYFLEFARNPKHAIIVKELSVLSVNPENYP